MNRLLINCINNRLKNSINDSEHSLGLFGGKMGLCIYFYMLDYRERNKNFKVIAEKLLEQVISQLHTIKSIDIENGLAGIGLAISFLLKKDIIKGNVNTVLSDIDDEIFKQISFRNFDKDPKTLIQILFYIYIRKESTSGELDYFFNELSIYIINLLHSHCEHFIEKSDTTFSIYTQLPLFLYALGKVYEQNVYNIKIKKIIYEITPFIISKNPPLDSIKLQLIWGISNISQQIKNIKLSHYCNFLASQINIEVLINEFYDKNMFFEHGLAGIALLMVTLPSTIKQQINTNLFFEKFIDKINESAIWKLNDSDLSKINLGLFGYTGVILITNLAEELV